MAKQAALGFVKRTLERCHQFEETGKSCFSDPLFKDMFLAESSKPHLSSLSVEARTGRCLSNEHCRDAINFIKCFDLIYSVFLLIQLCSASLF